MESAACGSVPHSPRPDGKPDSTGISSGIDFPAFGPLSEAFAEFGVNVETLGRSIGHQADAARHVSLQTLLQEAARYTRAVRTSIDDLDASAGELAKLELKCARSVASAQAMAVKAEAAGEAKKCKPSSGTSPFTCIGHSTAAAVDDDTSPGAEHVAAASAAKSGDVTNKPSSNAESAANASAILIKGADESRCHLEVVMIQLMAEVAHFHAQLSSELGPCLHAFVAGERNSSDLELRVWNRLLGTSVPPSHAPSASA